MKYYFIKHQHYSENTSAYGYGDFPDSIPYLAAIVEADTIRKAQNKVKKIFTRVRFDSNSPVNNNFLMPENSQFLTYYINLPLNHDNRLSPENTELHNLCVRLIDAAKIDKGELCCSE